MLRRVTVLSLILLVGLVVLSGPTALSAFTEAIPAAPNLPVIRFGAPASPAGLSFVPLTAPIAPAGLTATAGDHRVTLNWGANPESDIWYYKIYWSTGGPFTWIDSTLSPTTSWTRTGLDAWIPYYFMVTAVNTSKQEGPLSKLVWAIPFGPVTPPSIPTGLKATPGSGQITLTWNRNPEGNMFFYKIYWSAGGAYTWLDGTIHPTTTYVKTGLDNGTTYFFKVSAVNTARQESELSAAVYATPIIPTPPSIPTGLKAKNGNRQITLTWTPNSGSNTWFYKIYLSLNPSGPYTWLDGTMHPTSTYTKINLVNGAFYFFKVSAVSPSRVESPLSAYVVARPLPPWPTTPTGLRITNGSKQITLNWNRNPETDIWIYKIYWSPNTAAGPFTWRDGTISPTTVSTISGLDTGRHYFFKISAVNLFNQESAQTSYVTGLPTSSPVSIPGKTFGLVLPGQ